MTDRTLTASPAATGPAGEQFEAKVGASYVLAMLVAAEPRGLPGANVERIQLQAATDGFTLDDVIVHARNVSGIASVLEIQVKRSIAFSPADPTFKAVVGQVAAALMAGRLDGSGNHQLAIATAQTSRKIDGPYQEVLLWARHSESPDFFYRKLKRAGVASDDMRSFVSTLAAHLADFGAPADDRAVWTVLRHLQILVYDFAAASGQSDALARERCSLALVPEDRGKAGAFWSSLIDLVQETARTAGDIALQSVRDHLIRLSGFRLAGSRNNHVALTYLSEASRNALEDIRDGIGHVTLARRTYCDAVNAALDQSRYLELLGDAGVGKSGILKLVAEQSALSSKLVVLSPTRTIPRGWIAMRQAIEFEGSARDLLAELALSGGGTLFIDSADFFDEGAQMTVSDLVRAAAETPGCIVMVTARRSFGSEDPNWLPREAIDRLGRSTVLVDELTDIELDELRRAAPELVPLLAPGHPARAVVRNLFRLDRLAELPVSGPQPRTEAEMAKLWWETGDGPPGGQTRERTRILREIASRTLSADDRALSTSSFSVPPLEQLVGSGTLRDLGGERMVFRHDVFRDWAVANLLRESGVLLDTMPLAELVPASLARGVELAAHFAIEGNADSTAWKALLDRLSGPDVHNSWHRAVVLALVRSELSDETLETAKGHLLEGRGALLRELIRTTMAVDTAPAGTLLKGREHPIPPEIASLSIPTGPTWRRLAGWMSRLGSELPPNCLPEVAELYLRYAVVAANIDPLVDTLAEQIYGWLMEMERDAADFTTQAAPLFGGGLDYDKRRPLHDLLRSGFTGLSHLQPELAQDYLDFLSKNRRRSDGSAEHVVQTPGNLAMAAPAALAKLTEAVLIKEKLPDRHGWDDFDRAGPFTYADRGFMMPAPGKGPFLSLLTFSPKDGLSLIRCLTLHACTFSGNSDKRDDVIELAIDGQIRRFPYKWSYYWSRNANHHYCVTTALMALEAWAHRSIDEGEAVETVIRTVLGVEEVPVAYLLIVVDLLISHWPNSQDAGIAFVGTPELLSLDRSRQVHERMPSGFDLFADKEPPGPINRASLKARPSRKFSLEQLLSLYLFQGSEKAVEALRTQLAAAIERLGPYGPRASYADPALMAVHALNCLDRANYRIGRHQDQSGEFWNTYDYNPPEVEARHITPLQIESDARTSEMNLKAQISLAFGSSETISANALSQAIQLARDINASGKPQPDYDQFVLIAAALAIRDGDATLRESHGAWAVTQFRAAVEGGNEPVHRSGQQLQYNPAAIGTIGLVAAMRHGTDTVAFDTLLALAANGDPSFALGFTSDLDSLSALEPRLPAALLRCAFIGNIRPQRQFGDDADRENTRRRHKISELRKASVSAELRWLTGEGAEPAWPDIPRSLRSVRRRRKTRTALKGREDDRGDREEYFFDHQSAAAWLSAFLGTEPSAPAWLAPVPDRYRDWTANLNGKGLDRSAELSDHPSEWNTAYFRLVARSLPALDWDGIDRLCVVPVLPLPDKPFLDVMATLLLSLDLAYFEGKGVSDTDAVRIRQALGARMEETWQCRNYVQDPGYGVEIHLNQALSHFFFSNSGFRDPPQCYVTAIGIPRLIPFVPLLEETAGRSASLAVALMSLSIVSVSADHPFLRFGTQTIAACIKRFPNDTVFWVDYGVGRAFCAWISNVLNRDGLRALDADNSRADVERIAAHLIQLGVLEAPPLEEMLRGGA